MVMLTLTRFSKDDPAGVEVCLSCFNGGCLSEERHHARTHAHRTGHIFTLNVQRTSSDDGKYDTTTTITCWACDPRNGSKLTTLSGTERQIADFLTTAVMSAMSFARQSEVKALEKEIIACTHTSLLQQIPPDQGSALGTIFFCRLAYIGDVCSRRSVGTLQPM